MRVGAEPGSEMQGWGERVGAHRVLNKALSLGSKASPPLQQSSRRPYIAQLVSQPMAASHGKKPGNQI